MANPNFAHHGTLVASTAAAVTLLRADQAVEVVNRSGSAEIYFTVDGSTPTVGGDDCYVVPASVSSYVVAVGEAEVTVTLISSGTPTYSVIGGQP